tara:strand:+ start:973 stop:1146 length:174 start_codon:yes stop_codon:yes gene_type:complete
VHRKSSNAADGKNNFQNIVWYMTEEEQRTSFQHNTSAVKKQWKGKLKEYLQGYPPTI